MKMSQPFCITNVWFLICSKILPNVLHNTTLAVLLPWQHTGFQTPLLLKTFLPTFGVPFCYLLTAFHMHDPAYKYVSRTLWPCLTFFKLKITNILRSLTYWEHMGGDWKRVSCQWNRIFYSHRCVSCRTMDLSSFNVLRCKLVALFIYSI